MRLTHVGWYPIRIETEDRLTQTSSPVSPIENRDISLKNAWVASFQILPYSKFIIRFFVLSALYFLCCCDSVELTLKAIQTKLGTTSFHIGVEPSNFIAH
jgi:hypothetical protein